MKKSPNAVEDKINNDPRNCCGTLHDAEEIKNQHEEGKDKSHYRYDLKKSGLM